MDKVRIAVSDGSEPNLNAIKSAPHHEQDDIEIANIDPNLFPRPYLSEEFAKARHKQIRKEKFSNSLKITGVLAVFLLLSFVLGVMFTLTAQRANQHAMAEGYNFTNQNDFSQLPNEHSVDQGAIGDYRVPVMQPRYIVIPKLSVKARVTRMSVDYNSQLQRPRNIHDAGWYENSSKPGDGGGAILINGYMNGQTNEGVFLDLDKLVIGDKIQIIRGDSVLFQYKVIKTQEYSANNVDMAATMRSWAKGSQGLNIMAYSSPVDSKKTLVIFAAQQ